MNRNEEIMFSRDGRKFQKATFICNCELNASKIKLGSEEWTVKQSEVYSVGDYLKHKANNFFLDNERLIEAWHQAQRQMESDSELKISKADIARSIDIKPSKACRILSEWFKIHAPALAVK